jgi:SAM-dependent methyltransferase
MGKKEWTRQDAREEALALVRAGRLLNAEEIAQVKKSYSGIGGLCPADWSAGAFFTPPSVVSFVQDMLQIREARGAVLEPSCGGGSFLEGIAPERCTGIEWSADSCAVARACYPQARLIHSDAVTIFPYDRRGDLDDSFDFCIGNPPFSVKTRWGGDITGGRVATIPSDHVFMEIAVRAVKPGGEIAMIVPDGLLSNRASLYLREWLMARCFIRAVVSLPTETFYHASTSVKTSILYLSKFPPGVTKDSHGDYKIFMAIVEDIGWNSRGRKTGKCDLPKVLDAYRTFRIADEEVVGEVQPADSEPAPAVSDIPFIQPSPANIEPQAERFIQMALF